jgi:hypothetical protein
MVDDDAPHRLRGDSEEVSPVVVADLLTSEEAETQLVHQGVRLKRMIAPLALEQVRRNLPQPRVYDAENLVARVLVALPPACEPNRDLFWGWRHDTRTNESPLL